MSSGHKALAMAMVAAAKDLGATYKKVRHWAELDKQDNLGEYVQRELEKQETRRLAHERKQLERAKEGKKTAKFVANYNSITLRADKRSAADFFRSDSKAGDMFCSMIGLDIGDLPQAIVQQRDFVKQNAAQLEAKISAFRKRTERKIVDENHLAEKERTH